MKTIFLIETLRFQMLICFILCSYILKGQSNDCLTVASKDVDFVQLFLQKDFNRINTLTEIYTYNGDLSRISFNKFPSLSIARNAIGEVIYFDGKVIVSVVKKREYHGTTIIDIYINNNLVKKKVVFDGLFSIKINTTVGKSGNIYLTHRKSIYVFKKVEGKYKFSQILDDKGLVDGWFGKFIEGANSENGVIIKENNKVMTFIKFKKNMKDFTIIGKYDFGNFAQIDNLVFVDQNRFVGSVIGINVGWGGKRSYNTHLFYGDIRNIKNTMKTVQIYDNISQMQRIDDRNIIVGNQRIELNPNSKEGFDFKDKYPKAYVFMNDSIAFYDSGSDYNNASTHMVDLLTNKEVQLNIKLLVNYLNWHKIDNDLLFTYVPNELGKKGVLGLIRQNPNILELNNQLKTYLDCISKNNDLVAYQTFFDIALQTDLITSNTLEAWHNNFSKSFYSEKNLFKTHISDRIAAKKDQGVAKRLSEYNQKKTLAQKRAKEENKTFIEYTDGFYTGEVKDNKRHGYGTFVYKSLFESKLNPVSYEGEWGNDQKNGYGYEIFTETSSLLFGVSISKQISTSGNFVNGFIEGEGLYDGDHCIFQRGKVIKNLSLEEYVNSNMDLNSSSSSSSSSNSKSTTCYEILKTENVNRCGYELTGYRIKCNRNNEKYLLIYYPTDDKGNCMLPKSEGWYRFASLNEWWPVANKGRSLDYAIKELCDCK